MDAFSVLANQHARNALHDLGHSALPDAPVLPYVEPKHRARRLIAFIRHTAQLRPNAVATRQRPVTDCRPL